MNNQKQYVYVIAVADAGSISQAAMKLDIAQPTLSKYLQKTEQALGVELFDRSTIPIKLTKAGECFVEAGRRMIDLDRQLHKRLAEIKASRGMDIRIGVSPSRSPYLLPPILSRFCAANPDIHIIVEEGVTNELNEKLTSGKLDLMISLRSVSTEEFQREKLFDETILLAAHKDRAQKGVDAQALLRAAPLISLGRGQYLRDIVALIAPDMSFVKPLVESQNIESALSFVRTNIGVTLVPSYIALYGAEELNRDVRFLPLTGQSVQCGRAAPVFSREVCVFFRKAQFLTRAEQDFIQCAKACIPGHERR